MEIKRLSIVAYLPEMAPDYAAPALTVQVRSLDGVLRQAQHRYMNWVRQHAEGCILQVKVVPRASHTGVQGVLGDALKIRLQAPPVDGKANASLLAFLAETLGVPARSFELLRGESSRAKSVLVRGLTPKEVLEKLG